LSKFEQIKADIANLDASQLVSIRDMIAQFVQKQAAAVALESRVRNLASKPCVHCGFSALIRWGKTPAGTPRLKCRNCKATHVATHGTVFRGMKRRDQWVNFMGEMRRHSSILDMEATLRMSHTTMLRWRHRILSAFDMNSVMAGLVQADEKYFRVSYKGQQIPAGYKTRKRGGASKRGLSAQQVCVVTAADSNGSINQSVIGGRTKANILAAILPWLSTETVVVSDGQGAYSQAANVIGCVHIPAGQSYMNLNRINAYHTQIENLVNRKCLGVSTKHLSKYLAWARLMTQKAAFGEGLLEAVLA